MKSQQEHESMMGCVRGDKFETDRAGLARYILFGSEDFFSILFNLMEHFVH